MARPDRQIRGSTLSAAALRWLAGNFLAVGILTGAAVALSWPEPGIYLKAQGLVPALIVVIFVCSGLMLELGSLRQELTNLRAMLFAIVSINVIFPLAGLAVSRAFGISGEAFLGLVVIASAPPTLASGIIITTLAGGSTALAIVLTVLGNITAVVLMPLGLRIVLSLTTTVHLPVVQMLLKLFYLIVLPLLIGHLLGRWRPGAVRRHRAIISFVPNVAMVTIVFMLISEGSGRIRAQGPAILMVAVAALCLHASMLAVNHLAGRIMGLGLSANKALTIVASQKTLPVSALVVDQAFRTQPAAIMPCVVFHLLQILLDTLLAQQWARQSGPAVRSEPRRGHDGS